MRPNKRLPARTLDCSSSELPARKQLSSFADDSSALQFYALNDVACNEISAFWRSVKPRLMKPTPLKMGVAGLIERGAPAPQVFERFRAVGGPSHPLTPRSQQ